MSVMFVGIQEFCLRPFVLRRTEKGQRRLHGFGVKQLGIDSDDFALELVPDTVLTKTRVQFLDGIIGVFRSIRPPEVLLVPCEDVDGLK